MVGRVGRIETIWALRIKAARLARGDRQADLAYRAGYTQQQVSAWERGAPIPDAAKFAIARALGARVGDLFAWPEEANDGEAA
jgi:transcriptional regulator with XRE-family HTH domain